MIRLLPRPELLSSAMVAIAVTSGMAFGAAVVSVALALRAVSHGPGERRP